MHKKQAICLGQGHPIDLYCQTQLADLTAISNFNTELPSSQVQNAIEAGNAKAAMAKQATGGLTQRQVRELESVQLAAQANALAEMEHSHNASQRQLLSEMDYLRQQKAAAEERSIRADHIVSTLKP